MNELRIKERYKNERTGFSLEFFPPKEKEHEEKFKETMRKYIELKPLFASITYGAGGTTQDKTFEIVKFVNSLKAFAVMPHLTCIGATKDSVNFLIKKYDDLGVFNILALRGDPPKNVENFDISKGEFKHAIDLVKYVREYFDHFSIGVAFYPEGHAQASSFEEDFEHCIEKMKLADFAISQMFFENSYFLRYRDLVAKRGVDITLVPGIIPIGNFEKIKEFAKFCKVEIPKRLEDIMSKASSHEDMKKAGIDFATQQCAELIKEGVKFFHFYTLNQFDLCSKVIKNFW
ncbi:Methylenetetrahydrofolate reductase (NAD(P)H) [Thermodesulfobium narugense DSM 14796]|uniref:Methylenetetrahydrofolate reductase n=1 Tax=Thermodesulfobium narugense DSM 14796 TaxID=747365 RepID=M1E654_9BACT|nr:methylenetetrahydrofolate reductase [Thermodesulfobium narugense]AEE14003.1 Methylenetetrahydrofolate reductase (NAD(P)H) [Thermodesulfobium narugense DSM 14796]